MLSFKLLLTFWLLLLYAATVGFGAPLKTERTLWPKAPEITPKPQPVSIAQSKKPRDSAIFAGIVAFSAAVRLISAEMPLMHGATLNLIAFGFAGVVPTALASAMALIIESERQFSWAWAQLIMGVALLGVLLSFSIEAVDDAGITNSQKEKLSLRQIAWRPRWARLAASGTAVASIIAVLILLKGWDVMALSFAALVLIVLGIEPRLRSVSPVFNRLPHGFPHHALSVRSLVTGQPGPVVYRVRVSSLGVPQLIYYHSIYSNSSLGAPRSRTLLKGLIGKSLLGDGQQDTQLRSDEETVSLSATPFSPAKNSLEEIWPWLKIPDPKSFNLTNCRITIWVLEGDVEATSFSDLRALRLFVNSRAPPNSLESLLALCSVIQCGLPGEALKHFHVDQLWSQWLEVHNIYATSGLGYASDEGSENPKEACAEERGAKEELIWGEQYNVVLDMSFLPGGQPVLRGIANNLEEAREEVLKTRYFQSLARAGATGGDWVTRVCCANQVDEILSRQEEWAELLGMEVSPVSNTIFHKRLRGKLARESTGNFEGSGKSEAETPKVSPLGLIVPGPGYGLIELFTDRSLRESDFPNDYESSAIALLAIHAFDVVSWGSKYTGSKSGLGKKCKPSSKETQNSENENVHAKDAPVSELENTTSDDIVAVRHEECHESSHAYLL